VDFVQQQHYLHGAVHDHITSLKCHEALETSHQELL